MTGTTEPLGTLFEGIEYYNIDDLNKFVDKINEPQSYYIINLAIDMGFRRGIYSLQECEILSKALRIIQKT